MVFTNTSFARQCTTGTISGGPGQPTFTTTYCWTTIPNGTIYFTFSNGQSIAYDGISIGSDEGGSGIEVVNSQEIPPELMPPAHDDVVCSDPGAVRQAAANALFGAWRTSGTSGISRFRGIPNFQNYLITFSNGAEVYQWTNSGFTTVALTSNSGCGGV